MEHPKSPCNDCPYRRDVKSCHMDPSALGYSPPEVYIGQIGGPFYLPCHSYTDYNDPNWKSDNTKPQCAGAAIFRANTGVDENMINPLTGERGPMSKFFYRLPKDTSIIFSSFVEFYAHHAGVPQFYAMMYLDRLRPEMLTMMMLEQGGTVTLVPKG